jgi:Flp pilus assembly protein CpaB
MELAHKLFSTRGGTLLLAGIAAVLAAVAVLVYVKNYRSSVESGGQAATVLVAKTFIAKGTPGAVVAKEHLFQATQIRESQLRTGAISDPASLAGRVAATDIFSGQQITASAFVVSAGTVASQLTGAERAITIPIDAAHGLIGTTHSGDKVDVYAGFNVVPLGADGKPTGGTARAVLRLIVPNVPVIGVSGVGKNGIGSSGGASSVTLKATPVQASDLAFASDNGKLWLVLRPPSGGTTSPPNIVTVETLLLGVPPIAELKTFGARR